MISSTLALVRNTSFGLSVALALLAGTVAPSAASAAPATPAPGLAAPAPAFAEEGMSFSRFMHRYTNRAHVVQMCVVFMLIALFIIIKKLDGDGSPRPLSPRAPQGRRRDLTPVDCPRDGVSP